MQINEILATIACAFIAIGLVYFMVCHFLRFVFLACNISFWGYLIAVCPWVFTPIFVLSLPALIHIFISLGE